MSITDKCCKNCKWWDRKNAGSYADDPFEPLEANCNYPTPYWVRDEKFTAEHFGTDCNVFLLVDKSNN